MRFLFLIFLLVSSQIYSQTIVWEKSFNIPNDQNIKSICITDTGYLAFGQGRNFDEYSEILKIDTFGNLLWRKPLNFANNSISDSYSFDMVGIKNEQAYYVSGFYFASNGTSDFISKINSQGDTNWTFIYEPFGIYQTTLKLLTLKDKSVLSVGFQQQSGTGEDVYVRRLDSLGNLMWQKMYPISGNQRAFDITEMLDGSLIISGTDIGENLFLKIGIDGRLIIDSTITNFNSGFMVSSGNIVDPNNNLIGKNFVHNGISPYGNSYILNENLDVLGFWSINPNTENLSLNSDSNTLIVEYLEGFKSGIVKQNLNNQNIDSIFFNIDNTIRDITSMIRSDNQLVLCGAKGTSSNRDYWIAKISGVGEEWIPDRCSYQPPVAGFEYEYNYPLLTLRDTSTGGLKYLDTVYTWQWTTSAGATGNDDSLQVLFDTAVSKTLDVELVISNWYGCTDTINTTLDFTSTGIKEYLELEVRVFPNPTKDILNVHINNTSDHATFTLYDLQGRPIKTQRLINDQSIISLEKVSQGLYFYEITNGKNVVRGKVVRE